MLCLDNVINNNLRIEITLRSEITNQELSLLLNKYLVSKKESKSIYLFSRYNGDLRSILTLLSVGKIEYYITLAYTTTGVESICYIDGVSGDMLDVKPYIHAHPFGVTYKYLKKSMIIDFGNENVYDVCLNLNNYQNLISVVRVGQVI